MIFCYILVEHFENRVFKLYIWNYNVLDISFKNMFLDIFVRIYLLRYKDQHCKKILDPKIIFFLKEKTYIKSFE